MSNPQPKSIDQEHPILNNWSTWNQTAISKNFLVVFGNVTGHASIADDTYIHTSQVVSADGHTIKTLTGSTYKLGTIDPRYREFLRIKLPDWNPDRPIIIHKEPRKFFMEDQFEKSKIIAVVEGEQGFHETDITDTSLIHQMNELQGITPTMCNAAKHCSMWNKWDDFDNLVATYTERDANEIH
tara:strand:+ start:511 stop:1062 length:552 start_codon:yes stop_codon:yes gene_type:complete